MRFLYPFALIATFFFIESAIAAEAEPAAGDHGPPPLGTGGWVLGGLGLGGLATSVATFWVRETKLDQLQVCARGLAFLVVECDTDALKADARDLQLANITSFSLGLAAVAAGATMVLFDFLAPDETGVHVGITPGGGALRVELW